MISKYVIGKLDGIYNKRINRRIAIATCILINHRIYYSKKGIECDANASI